MSQDQAREKARKCQTLGFVLYMSSNDTWEWVFGSEGRGIFDVLDSGEYSNVS